MALGSLQPPHTACHLAEVLRSSDGPSQIVTHQIGLRTSLEYAG